MVSETQRRQNLFLAENAALLSLLSKAPIASQSNPRTAIAGPDPTRLLSFERESSLTNTLAFLSGISDDPSHVVATCVEELPRGNGIRVVVAINKMHPSSGNDVLARIKSGLEEIFRRLAQLKDGISSTISAADSDAILQDRVLDAIILMCTNRILGRIGSQRSDAVYFKKGRAFFGSTIQQSIDAVHQHAWKKKASPRADKFIKSAALLLERLEDLEGCPQKDVLPRIKRVLRAAHRLDTATDFDKVFSGITSKELNPTTRTGFESRLKKLAMYQQCSLYLFQMAKDSPLFENAAVTCVSLDTQLFARSGTTPDNSCLASCISRCRGATKNLPKTKAIKTTLNTNDSDFRLTVQKILRESRVHAEVQIVCYYELHPAAKKPRVICSSKDACYLCKLFIQLHGTYHIPRTHGNLYPGWRLLPIPALDDIQARFNISLEAKIGEFISRISNAPNSGVMLSQNANESSVFPFSILLPALASSTLLIKLREMNATVQHPLKEHRVTPEVPLNPPFQISTAESPDSITPDLQVPHIESPSAEQTQTPITIPSPESFHNSGGSNSSAPETQDNPGLEVSGSAKRPHEQTAAFSQDSLSIKPDVDITIEPKSELEQGQNLESEEVQGPDPNQIQKLNSRCNSKPSPTNSRVTPFTSLPSEILLTRGQPFSLPLTTRNNPDVLPSFTAGSITIYPDLILTAPEPSSSSSSSLSRPTKADELRVEWLARERAAAFYVARPRGFVTLDGGSIKKGVEIDGGSGECVYVARGGEVVMVEVVRGMGKGDTWCGEGEWCDQGGCCKRRT